MIEHDPQRPRYHFTGVESWINDPNGPIYWNGVYHLFYQYDPMVRDDFGDWARSKRCWGHAVSGDLVHWRDWPVAIWPDSDWDREGVYSGNVVIDGDGVPTAVYTGYMGGRRSFGMTARSYDGMLTWDKRMVMSEPPFEGAMPHWDGFVWKEEGEWFQLTGGSLWQGNPVGVLWSSPDLEQWRFRSRVFNPVREDGKPNELPYLVRVDGVDVYLEGWGGLATMRNPCWMGRFDREELTFRPDHDRPINLDPGLYYSFNANMTDDRGPNRSHRRLLHGWVTMPTSPAIKRYSVLAERAHDSPRAVGVRRRALAGADPGNRAPATSPQKLAGTGRRRARDTR